jgi:hypothetical protein
VPGNHDLSAIYAYAVVYRLEPRQEIRKRTGRLSNVAGHVARTTEGNWMAFHEEPKRAELAAMTMMRSQRTMRAICGCAAASPPFGPRVYKTGFS